MSDDSEHTNATDDRATERFVVGPISQSDRSPRSEFPLQRDACDGRPAKAGTPNGSVAIGPIGKSNLQAVPPEQEMRATERFFDERVTDRFEAALAPASEASRVVPEILAAGDLVAERYRVLSGPLGAATAEAEVYRCEDTETGRNVALKLYRPGIVPKSDIVGSLHLRQFPHVVGLKAYGTWARRAYEIMDYCPGGSVTARMPYNEQELRRILEQVSVGLNSLHAFGIVHRDIKPNNLLLRDPDVLDVAIGDFGISSHLEPEENVRKTGTGMFFTLDYAAPELLDGKEVSPKTDFYALGVTLLHLHLGHSPFQGIDKYAIIARHFRGNMAIPEDFSAEFRQLIEGLTRVDPESRWGHEQVMSWLHGGVVFTDEGMPDHEEAAPGKALPYRNLPEITMPHQMAARLGDFDVEKDLGRGYISQWLMFFDTQLGRRVAELEEEFADDLPMAVFKLRYLLDPRQPLQIGDVRIFTIQELAEFLKDRLHPGRPLLGALLYSHCIEVWVSALGAGEAFRELSARIADIRTRIKNQAVALAGLLFTIDPSYPLEVGRGVFLTSPEDIGTHLENRSGVDAAMTSLLYDGYLEEWMRAAFPDRTEDVAFLAECVKDHAKDREQGLFALRCHFCPSTPIRCGGAAAATPEELAAIIDRDPYHFEQGMWLLRGGRIRTWLVHTGRLENPKPFDNLIWDDAVAWPRKMEAVLHLLDPELPWPQVEADVASIDAGAISPDKPETVQIEFRNAGRGYLAGTVTLAGRGGFLMRRARIEGEPVVVDVQLDARGLSQGAFQRARVVADTNGGRVEVPVTFRVNAPLSAAFLRSLLAGAIAGLALGYCRMMLQLLLPEYRAAAMDWFGAERAAAYAQHWGLVPVAIGAIAAIGGLTYYAAALAKLNR